MPTYDEARSMELGWDRYQVDRTKNGLLLLLIGIVLGPIPYIRYLGALLSIIGVVLLLLGRKILGPEHSRNTVWSVAGYLLGLCIILAGLVGFSSDVSSIAIAVAAARGNLDQAAAAQTLSSALNTFLVLTLIGGATMGAGELLLTYALQRRNGKILLWTTYAAIILTLIVTFMILSPLLGSVAAQSFANGSFDPSPIASLQSQLATFQLLGLIPSVMYGTAIYMAWSRIDRGDLPEPDGVMVA